MPYTKQNDPWVDYPGTSTPLSAADLDGIEAGIATATTGAEAALAGTATNAGAITAVGANTATNATNLTNHLNDTVDAHDASAISVADTAGNYAGTEVEAVLAEIASTPAGDSFPSGVMMAYGATAAPTGWLICDGTAVSRTTYADLFTAIGTTFGSGNGSTTFNVPDLRGRVAVGYSSGGASEVSAMANNDGYSNTTRNVSHHHTYERPNAGNDGGSGSGYVTTNASGIKTSGDTNNADHPAYLVIQWIIKT